MMPLISIIVPIYNVEDFLDECIESLINQTYKNIEIILINDGSTDNSAEICNFHAKTDKRIIVIHQKNAGVSNARNKGLVVAKGEYIGFVDSDDWLDHEMYEVMINSLLENKAQLCISTKYYIDNKIMSNANIKSETLNSIESIKKLLLSNFTTSLCSCLYNRNSIDGIYLNESIHFWEDFEYQFRVLCNIQTVATCNKSFYNYRQREGSANHQQINEKIISCLKISPLIEKYISNNLPELNEYAKEINIKFIITIIYVMSYSVNFDRKYYKLAKEISRANLRIATVSKNTSFKNKILIILNALNPMLFYFFFRLARKIKNMK